MSGIKALMIGVGGVGEAIARMAAEKSWLEVLVLAGEFVLLVSSRALVLVEGAGERE